ncbi:uncharacterized protein J4E84_010230 [Alternaria hordeiaustralica]|uniref:uncharacterized protein n=1 Tax=Alternaria hordeiaustralica TaxID=1187925 RepID=UPI0020C43A34|nr:uncharacterized protein J4E84_010230 [Alternaria hordeiaustralica]KAI4675229.1 hypothetical protein J4E84_010230 [Alternaria hordeiaustralica]
MADETPTQGRSNGNRYKPLTPSPSPQPAPATTASHPIPPVATSSDLPAGPQLLPLNRSMPKGGYLDLSGSLLYPMADPLIQFNIPEASSSSATTWDHTTFLVKTPVPHQNLVLPEDDLNIDLGEDDPIDTVETGGDLGVKRKRQDDDEDGDQSFDEAIGKKIMEGDNTDDKDEVVGTSKEDVTTVAKEEGAGGGKHEMGGTGEEKPRRDVMEEGTEEVVVENDAEGQKEVDGLLLQALDEMVEEPEKEVADEGGAAKSPLEGPGTLLDPRRYPEAAGNGSNVVAGRAATTATVPDVLLPSVHVNEINSGEANLRGFLQGWREELAEEVKSTTATSSAPGNETASAAASEGLVRDNGPRGGYATQGPVMKKAKKE